MQAEAGPGKPSAGDVAQAIARAKRELEAMIDLSPQGMLLLNPQGCVTRANRAFLRLSGKAGFGEVLGRPLVSLLPFEGDENAEKLLDVGAGYAVHDACVLGNGAAKRILRFSAVPGGTANVTAMIVEDVTEARAAETDLEQRHKTEAVQALTGALMHNLNQPLTVIMMRAKLLHMALEQGAVEPGEMRKALEDIMELVRNISVLLEKARKARRFVTEPYLRGRFGEASGILDLDRAGTEAEGS